MSLWRRPPRASESAGGSAGVPFTGKVQMNVNMCGVCMHMRVLDTLVECVIKKS